MLPAGASVSPAGPFTRGIEAPWQGAHNNLAENAIRPFALGRKNWLFMCTEDGAEASANIYSLLITAKANGIEPVTYLTRVIERLPSCKTIEDYETLLPA